MRKRQTKVSVETRKPEYLIKKENHSPQRKRKPEYHEKKNPE